MSGLITWLHIAGGLMVLWFPITGLICIGKEDGLMQGLKCFFTLLLVICGIGVYLAAAWWLITV